MASRPPRSNTSPDASNNSNNSHSNSSAYDANNESSPPSSEQSTSSSPLILYSPPTIWGLLRGAGINLILPFINGLMLGFGELLAHEVAFRWGWSETKVFPDGRSSRSVGPGVEIRDDPVERRQRDDGEEMEQWTSLE